MPRAQPLLDRLVHRLADLRLTLHQVQDHAVGRLVPDDGEDDFTYRLPRLHMTSQHPLRSPRERPEGEGSGRGGEKDVRHDRAGVSPIRIFHSSGRP